MTGRVVDLAARPPAADETAATVAACREAMAAGGLSMARASREIGAGVSQATLSQWLAGRYAGDVAAVTGRVRRWLDTRAAAAERDMAALGLDRYVALGAAEQVELALVHAHAAGDVVAILGRSGCGKTTALRRYVATHASATYLAATGAIRTMGGLLGRVAAACGLPARHPSALAAETAIVEHLTGRRALLIVDEAHHLSPVLLDELRCLRDASGAGLALAGDETLAGVLMGRRGCDQILGRIGVRLDLGRATDGDALDLATAVLDRALTAPERRLVAGAARGPGGLHALRRLLARAWVVARAGERDRITGDDLAAAAEGAS